VKWGGITAILIGFISLFFFVNSIMTEFSKKEIDLSKLDKHTSQGNLYEHDLKGKYTENGHYVWIYYCENELEQSWNQRSSIKFHNKDLKGNQLSFTLVRYLASKGLRKDADALRTLTDEEIKAIERGVVNVNYPDMSSLRGRLHEICWELELYKTSGDPNGHSLTQRFEYWKAALNIIKENTLIGVGTGDVQKAFDVYYEKTNSSLFKEWRLRAHNQYLSIAVAFGIIGLIWFLFSLIYPVIKQKMVFDYLYITFFIIALVSFFTEDTLETQAGVTFYAFLNTFFLFGREKEERAED
ncbi:MAG: O-antigen ligase family protein, partial [Bacteroidota bacterium]